VEDCKSDCAKLTLTSTLALHLATKHNLNNEGTGAVSGEPAQTILSAYGARLIAHNVLNYERRAEMFEAITSWVLDDKQAF
jgi:hypothetical protein